jgi:hypothetical protein
MSAPTRWRDAMGREWVGVDSNGVWFRSPNQPPLGHWSRATIELLFGPLTPVEPMARVDVRGYGYAYTDEALGYVVKGRDAKAASTWPLARAEEIAAAFRTLGYADATVAVVE